MTQENRTGVRTFTAGAALGVYLRVKLDATQQAVLAGVDEAGIGTVEVGVANAEQVSVRLWDNPGTRKVVCAGAVVAGAQLFGAAGGKVDDATTGGPVLYIALTAGSGNGSIIEAIPIHQSVGGSSLVFANVANSATITNTVAETDFDKSWTSPAGDLREGDVLDIEAEVTTPATNAADTLILRLKVGTETIVTSPTVDVANDDVGHIKARVVVRVAGAGGNLEATGTVALGVPGTVTAKPFRLAGVAEDLSGAVVVKVTAQWSAANAGNQAVLEHLSIVRHRK
jgi:hypothetical protein